MPYAKTITGEIIHFPGHFTTDDAGVIIPPTEAELDAIVASVRHGWLLSFSFALLRAAKKHNRFGRHARLNRARLVLARKLLARATGCPESGEAQQAA